MIARLHGEQAHHIFRAGSRHDSSPRFSPLATRITKRFSIRFNKRRSVRP